MHVLWSAYLLVAVAVQCPAHSQPGCFSVCQKRQLLAAASTGGFLKQQLRGVSRRFACMHAALQPCSLISSVFVSHTSLTPCCAMWLVLPACGCVVCVPAGFPWLLCVRSAFGAAPARGTHSQMRMW